MEDTSVKPTIEVPAGGPPSRAREWEAWRLQ